MDTFARNHPLIFVILLILAWFLLLLVCMGILSSALRKPYGDAASSALARLALTAGLLLLAWRLGWLESAGIARLGSWPAWLLALAGLVYFACASLYSFYGKVSFDFASLARLPAARSLLAVQFMAGLNEEILFRGLVLYALAQAWGNTPLGVMGSVAVTALIFSVLHVTQVFTSGVSPAAALLLVVQTLLVSIWWGAVVLIGGSIWPAVLLHFVGNALVSIQALSVPMIEPNILAYKRLLWFSLPLGLLGLGLLTQEGWRQVSAQLFRSLPPQN
jgi:membrane protease YdiL (CAAX protease family)